MSLTFLLFLLFNSSIQRFFCTYEVLGRFAYVHLKNMAWSGTPLFSVMTFILHSYI